MNNHIKTCPYCQGDGVVTKDWEDIKIGDKVNYYGKSVIVIDESSDDAWIVSDGKNQYTMFEDKFGGFIKD